MNDQDKKPQQQKVRVVLELEISGTSDLKDCKIDSIASYPGRPNALQLELLEKMPGSVIGRPVPAGKVMLSYNNDGVAAMEHVDLSSCDRTSQFEVRVSIKGEIHTSKPATVKVAAVPAPAKTAPKSPYLKLGATGVVHAKKFKAMISIETFNKAAAPSADDVVEVTVVDGLGVNFTNARNNAVLASNACYCELSTDADGTFRLGVDFKPQFEVTLELRHRASNHKETVKLVYQQ